MTVSLDELTQAQRDRLAFIDLRARFLGEVQRQDLTARFGVQAAAASRDLAAYKDFAPQNLDYDARNKVYVPSEWFRPLFSFTSQRVLTWLTQGYGDSAPTRQRPLVSAEAAAEMTRPDLEPLSVVTRAIHRPSAVEITYRALTSGVTTRQVVPFALADSGTRWHVRAFDRRTRQFRDFVIARITNAKRVPGEVAEAERMARDAQWNRIVELELVPHPANVSNPDTIEAEYGMTDGVLRTTVRAALVGYMLRRWNVDCTSDHSLKGGEYHLWLRNSQALYGVENIILAPGYQSPSRS